MPSLYFVIFEIIIYALFAACLWHAWRRGPHVAWQLLAGVIFGVLLERATIRLLIVVVPVVVTSSARYLRYE